MNKRLKRKRRSAIRKEIHRLLDIALDINGLSERNREITGDLPTAFFEFIGHVGLVSISVYDKGWGWGVFNDLCINADLNKKQLTRAVEELKNRYPGKIL